MDEPTPAMVDPEKQPITELYIDTPTLVRARSAGGELWRAWMDADPKSADTVFLQIYTSGTGGDFRWKLTDADHMVLTAVPPKNAPRPRLRFGPLPSRLRASRCPGTTLCLSAASIG